MNFKSINKPESLYNLKLILSGDRIEIYKFNNYLVRQNIDKDPIQEDNNKTKKYREHIRKDTLRKARNNVVRLISANDDMDIFITLTFRNESNYIESKRYLNNMFTKLRKDNKNLKYLWILEYGEKKGRLHYHLLTNLKIDAKLYGSKEKKSKKHKLIEQEFSKKYWKHGIVDIRRFNKDNNMNVALYVSEYMTKSFDVLNMEGYRIYGYSKNTLLKPIQVTMECKDTIEDILNNFKNHKVRYSNSYTIGYETWKGETKGTVTYFDLYKKENEVYENK